ncbi:MAG TPA: hypothetical protein VK835_02620 [Bacteroidia bacterium]|nr:hypothetical protein [Bacteroidia bacterium]
MKTILTILFALLLSTNIFAQKTGINDFVLKGYSILDKAQGDLNQDGYQDYIVILRNNLDTSFGDTARPLLIIHGQQNGTYNLVEQNSNVVLCKTCGGAFGDPYSAITIKNNYFSVEFYGGSNWRWSRVITFKYNLLTKSYILHKDAGESFNALEPDKTEYENFHKELWNKKPFQNYDAEYLK